MHKNINNIKSLLKSYYITHCKAGFSKFMVLLLQNSNYFGLLILLIKILANLALESSILYLFVLFFSLCKT